MKSPNYYQLNLLSQVNAGATSFGLTEQSSDKNIMVNNKQK